MAQKSPMYTTTCTFCPGLLDHSVKYKKKNTNENLYWIIINHSFDVKKPDKKEVYIFMNSYI